MKGIVIFSNCTFSRAALHSILIDLYPGAEIKDADASDPLDLIDTDRIIFILNECNLLYYSEFFLKYCKYIPYEKIILLGDERNNLIFNAIACHEYKHIDITLPTKILIDEFSAAISQRKSIYGEKKNKNAITSYEIEVVRMLSAGHSLSEIAFIKRRSLKTISHYKCSFFRKLGLENRLVTLLKITQGTERNPEYQYKHDLHRFLEFYATT